MEPCKRVEAGHVFARGGITRRRGKMPSRVILTAILVFRVGIYSVLWRRGATHMPRSPRNRDRGRSTGPGYDSTLFIFLGSVGRGQPPAGGRAFIRVRHHRRVERESTQLSTQTRHRPCTHVCTTNTPPHPGLLLYCQLAFCCRGEELLFAERLANTTTLTTRRRGEGP